jgi:hypothetical protein
MSAKAHVMCGCCRDIQPLGEANWDADINNFACKDCITQLRWAQAYLKVSGMRECKRHDTANRIKP